MSSGPDIDPHVSAREKTATSLFRWILLAIAAGIAVVGVTTYAQDVLRKARMRATRTQCRNNLKQIALALHNYHEAYGMLPPPYTVDANGQPLHSWRTLILPYIDQEPLYQSIDLSKPWNDPANAKAYNTQLNAFRCSSEGIPNHFTTYLAIVGDEFCFAPGQQRKFIRDIADGTANTLAVIDVAPELAVHWMSPTDASEKLVLAPKSRHSHDEGTYVLILDGSVRFLPDTVPADTLRALLTIAGHETIRDW